MALHLTRRRFIAWAGAFASSAPLLAAACSSAKKQLPTEGVGQHPPAGGGSFVINGKTYPFKDPKTGELLYHEKIRFLPKPGVRRQVRQSPVELLDAQPKVVESRDGVLDLDLDIAFADVVVNGQTMRLRTYNGALPGPTLVARPGDVLRIRENNKLPPEAPMPHENVNHPHGFNDVNLHTHGLNVSPEDVEDNVLIAIHPGESLEHEIPVAPDHPTGTFWYHPHKHGSTATQVGSGMAGMLLLKGDGDVRAVPEVGAAREVVLVFQELYVEDGPDGVGSVPGMPTAVEDYFYSDKIRNEITVNGHACTELGKDGEVLVPVLRMRPGEVQHWRMCHAGIFHNWPFAIDGHQVHEIAYDGITLENPRPVDEFEFVSGQRRDILVQASRQPGTYAVRRKAYKQAAEVNTWPEITLFNLVVAGDPVEMSLPRALNPPAARLPYIRDDEIVYRREIPFDFVDNTEQGIFLFTVGGKVFKPGRVDYTMMLGTAEEWTVTNSPSSDHPFHIHVNWFELHKLIDGSGKETVFAPPIWMDTLNLPANGRAVIRSRFERFQGKAVFHCHFLTHEDEGMMSLIEFVDGSPRAGVVGATGGTFLSGDYENKVQARFPKGAVPGDTNLTYQRLASPSAPTLNPAPGLPAGFADFDMFFRLTAEAGGRPVSTVARPFTIEVKFSAAQVDSHVSANDIGLFRYDERARAWTRGGVGVLARSGNLLTCSTKLFGTFAVSGRITPCYDFVAPAGVGPEDVDALMAIKDSPYEYFRKPFDVAPVGAPDGVVDDKDAAVVKAAKGQFCG